MRIVRRRSAPEFSRATKRFYNFARLITIRVGAFKNVAALKRRRHYPRFHLSSTYYARAILLDAHTAKTFHCICACLTRFARGLQTLSQNVQLASVSSSAIPATRITHDKYFHNYENRRCKRLINMDNCHNCDPIARSVTTLNPSEIFLRRHKNKFFFIKQ